MKVCGVICEYNPFHNGHAHQLARARAVTNADYVVCAMSGPFVQRGDAAILDKWTRAECAIANGADLVLELPVLHAVRAAQDFALGGVALLHGLGVVTHLSFGAEDDDLTHLRNLAAPETPEQAALIQQYLAQGLSHPAARAKALGGDLPPNVTLAVEYLRAIKKLGSNMEPVPVLRKHAHNDPAAHEMASATAIRAQLHQGNADLAHAMPATAYNLTMEHLPTSLPSLSRFSDILLYLLRTTTPEELREAYAIPEGLEHRLLRAAAEVSDLDALLTRVRCRRYPDARIRRLLVHILLGVTADLFTTHPVPEYARVLAFRKSAAPLLRAISRASTLPLLTKIADAPLTPTLALDLRAQNIWALAAARPAHLDLTEPIRVRE